jgi:hypothetical protein
MISFRTNALFLLLSIAAAAEASKSGSSQDQHEVFAVPVEGISKNSAKSMKMPKSTKKPNSNDQQDLHRFTMQVRTTLTNVDMNALTPAETVFFEDSWMSAFETVQDGGDLKPRSMIVETHHETPKKGKRAHQKLRGGRGGHGRDLGWSWSSTTYDWTGSFFDVSALFEFSCILCDYNRAADDDRNDDVYYSGKDEDDDDFFSGIWGGGWGGGGRKLNRDHDRFGDSLCDTLREGPFEVFQGVEDCFVTFAA